MARYTEAKRKAESSHGGDMDSLQLKKKYPKNLSTIRQKEFSRLKDNVYLDFTGSTLYSEKQMKQYTEYLQGHVFGNPHSGNPSSDLTAKVVDDVRAMVLSHFNVTPSEYHVIFTSGTTASLKLLAESFAWAKGKSCFAYLEDNHTSVIGIRETAMENQASSICLCIPSEKNFSNLQSYEQKNMKPEIKHHKMAEIDDESPNLFAYAAQSNFHGHKYPLDWIEQVHQDGMPVMNQNNNKLQKWYILLDAAAFVPTSPLDLRKHNADFVCMSFYKMFGFPTGIGALLVRSESAGVLHKKTYFGGGTTDLYLASQRYVGFKSKLHEKYEDGTIGFLNIVGLQFGFETLNRITGSMQNISDHLFTLTKLLYYGLKKLSHKNNKPLCQIYSLSHCNNQNEQGPIIAFNILNWDESHVGYLEVLKAAACARIHLRGGCFCNYGSCNVLLRMGEDRMKDMHQMGYKCGDVDLVGGVPVGAVRVSLGYMTTANDVKIFLKFLRDQFKK